MKGRGDLITGEESMKSDDAQSVLDRNDFDGDGQDAEPLGRIDDLDVEPDDALLEAELGAHEIDFDDVDDVLNEDEDDDDDREMALLHELGIDFDAPDGPVLTLEALGMDEEACFDEEVAA